MSHSGPSSSHTSTERGAQLGYHPALDGIRAIAVGAVMLYHGGVPWAAGGFLGVDIFFVLSGFLITSLLVKEWTRTGTLRLRAFWLRRARRLVPAMLVVLLAVAAVFLVSPQEQSQLRGDSIATLAYVSNWWFMVSDQSYFAQFLDPSPLRHTWSLAIEEQFYILFPLLLVVLLRRARIGLRGVSVVLALGVIGSAVLMATLYDPLTDPSRVYYGTDTRMHALLLGSVLGVIMRGGKRQQPLYTRFLGRMVRLPGWRMLGGLALGGLALMLGFAREQAPWMYRGGFLLAALLSALVIAAVWNAPGSRLARALSWRPLVAVGVVSYGLYLWHWPVFVMLNHERTGLTGVALLVVRVGVTAALAYLSFRFVEEPIRTQRLQRLFTPTQWGRAVTAAFASVLAMSLWASAAAQPSVEPTASAGARPAPVPDADGRLARVFLLGDSQSLRLRDYFGNRVDGLAVSGSNQLGCGTLLPERVVDETLVPNLPACSEWEARWTAEVARESPDVLLLMLGLGELYDRRVDGATLRFGTDSYRDWLYREIDRRRALVSPTTTRFAVATALCIKVSADAANNTSQIANDPERLAWLNDTIRSYVSAHADVSLIDLHDTVCADGYTNLVEGVTLRDDGLHLTEPGAALVWRRIGPAVIAAAP